MLPENRDSDRKGQGTESAFPKHSSVDPSPQADQFSVTQPGTSHLEKSFIEELSRTARPVGMYVANYLDVGRPSPLWVLPFPMLGYEL